MNQSLYSLYSRRLITLDEAMGRSNDPDELTGMIEGRTGSLPSSRRASSSEGTGRPRPACATAWKSAETSARPIFTTHCARNWYEIRPQRPTG